MKITTKCVCGATFDGECERDPFVRSDFLKAFSIWQEKHNGCAEATRMSQYLPKEGA